MTDLATELQVRAGALSDIIQYIEYLRPEFLPDFDKTPAQHHHLMAKELADLANQAHDRTAVSQPPGAAKSFYCSVVYPTWEVARNPAQKVLALSASENLGEDFSRRRRQILLSERWQKLSSTQLMPDAQSLVWQGFKEGGGIRTAGAGSIIQGIRADILVADDIVTGHEQAGNLGQLDKIWNWYISEARARLKPGGRELMVATRWALLDPIGRVLKLTAEGDEHWRYIRIPMVCDDDNDPLGRKPGDRLWPEYFTERMVLDAQRNPLVWNTLYQQRPAASEFSWVPAECIHIETHPPQNLVYYLGVDIALHVGKGDFTVIAVVGVDEANNFWLVDLWRQQADPEKSSLQFIALCKQYKPRYCWIEDDNASKVWHRLVAMKAQSANAPLLLSKMRGRKKEDRAAPLRTLFIQQRIRLLNRPWTQLALAELAEFPGGRHDDIVDAFGVVAKEMHKISPAKRREVDERPSIIGAIQVKGGKLFTTQTLDEMLKLNAGNKRVGRI